MAFGALAKGGKDAGARVFGDIAKSKTDLRTRRNDFKTMLAEEKNLDPNRRLGDALHRNRKLNLIQNLGGFTDSLGSMATNEGGVRDPVAFNKGLADVYLRSASKGINPQLLSEMGNIAGIPGLTIQGEEIAKDIMPGLKGAGAGEVGFGGLSAFFGGKK